MPQGFSNLMPGFHKFEVEPSYIRPTPNYLKIKYCDKTIERLWEWVYIYMENGPSKRTKRDLNKFIKISEILMKYYNFRSYLKFSNMLHYRLGW